MPGTRCWRTSAAVASCDVCSTPRTDPITVVPEYAREDPQMSQLRFVAYTSRPQLHRQSQRVEMPGRGAGGLSESTLIWLSNSALRASASSRRFLSEMRFCRRFFLCAVEGIPEKE